MQVITRSAPEIFFRKMKEGEVDRYLKTVQNATNHISHK